MKLFEKQRWDRPKGWLLRLIGRKAAPSALSRIESYLRENKVSFDLLSHPEAFSAPERAEAIQAAAKQVAKVVIVRAKHRYFMAVLPSHLHVDPRRMARVLWVDQVSLATEDELKRLFPDCETGAMPPMGNLYEIPVYLDISFGQEPVLYFAAGTHRDVIKMSFHDFKRLVKPKIGSFSDASVGQLFAS